MPFKTPILVIGALLLFIISSHVAMANSFSRSGYVEANLGASLQTADGSTNVDTRRPGNPDSYQVSNLDNSLAFGLEAGYQWHRAIKEHFTIGDDGHGDFVVQHPTNPWFANYQLGLRYQQASAATLNGTVAQYLEPEFKNYNYSYSLNSQRLLFMGRTDIYTWKSLSAFAELGVGYEIDDTTSYDETATSNVTPRIPPAYSAASNGSLTYLFGLGLKVRLNSKFWLSLSDDFNKSQMDKTGTDNMTNSNLENTVNSQTVLFSLGYLFK